MRLPVLQIPTFLLILLMLGAVALLAGCERPTESRAITAAGPGDLEEADSDTEDRIAALDTARTGIPREEFGLAYVYHEPGIPLLDVESVSLNDGEPQPISSGRYLVWEVSPGPHLLEAWRGDRRLATQTINVFAGEAVYLRYAGKGLYGGVQYLSPVAPNQGRAIISASSLASP
ncbi:MAG: hypothetical protein ACPGOY_13995 [Rhodospirillaceae bacterium]